MFTLYTTPLSANGRKALAVSRHLGLAPAIRLVDVYRGEGRTPEYLSINPWGKIPTLVDGDLILWESNAIVEYLAEAYGDYGDQLTLADFCVGAMPMYGRVAGFPFESFAGIAAWYARVEALEAWKSTAVGPWAY